MDIYEDDGARGVLDIRKARRELAASATINIEGVRRSIVAEITAGALLDIAYSLRPIGAEAADAMSERVAYATFDDAELDEPAPVRDLVIGDLVVVIGDDRPGEIVGLGYDQESRYALVRFAESGDEIRVWAHLLEHVDDMPEADEREADIVAGVDYGLDESRTEFEEKMPPLLVEKTAAGVTIEELDEDDDLERDFDTDTSGLAAIAEPPAPAVSPLDALAEKAPAKKAKKK